MLHRIHFEQGAEKDVNLRHLSWRRKADGEWDLKELDRVVSSKIRSLLGDGHGEE